MNRIYIPYFQVIRFPNFVIICFFFLLIPLHLYAQSVTVEIEARSASDQYHIVPMAQNGVMIFFEVSRKNNTSRNERWIFTKYDTTFTEIWATEYLLLNNLTFSKYYVDNENIYILFTRLREFQIVKIDNETGELSVTNGKIKYDVININDFKVINNFAYFGGNTPPSDASVFTRSVMSFVCFPLLFLPNFIPNRSAFLIHTSLDSKLTRDIQFNYKGFSEIASIEVDTTGPRVYAIVKNGHGKNSAIFIQDFKLSGFKNKAYTVKPIAKNRFLLDGKMKLIDQNEKLLMGTYSINRNAGAQGIYISKMIDNKQKFIHYNSFTEFQNFFEYMSTRQKERIKQKIKEKKKKGKELDLAYQLLIHEPVVMDTNQYIMVAEAYYPQYHTEYITSFYYGRPIENSIQVFDGWRYTHAIIAGFDTTGKLLWDNYFTIQDILSPTLTEKIKILKDDNRYVLAYNNMGAIQYKIIQDNQLLEDKSVAKIEIDYDKDRVKEVYNSDVEYWYKNYFIAYGIQKIKDTEADYVKKNKTVFYFNKTELKTSDK